MREAPGNNIQAHQSPRTIAEISPVNFAMGRQDLEVASADMRYFMQRRDALVEKLYFGSLTLNGASLIALLTVAGGPGDVARWLALSQGNVLFSSAAFALGAIAAGYGLNAQANLYVEETGDAFARASALNRYVATFQDEFTETTHARHRLEMEKLHKMPATGFHWSWQSITARAVSGGAWLAGVLLPVISTVWPRVALAWTSARAYLGF